ncbi:diaminopimelate decarboxylase [Chondrinema litorale]|uniref:diaminopimelate decarboxylase n=1 Tax=Chondrinema litorale TaxID=2994555 RepID=UPI0025446EF9|nr:diaminopimelate decarboxylase [Chondrinema litorale]UZR93676.1 diaminopimelate decarboxylase [Chondrinema litorale]
MRLEDNIYFAGENTVASVCNQFGTPLYLYDSDKIVEQIKTFKQAFNWPKLKVKFAMKSLSNISILKLMKAHGVELDAVSLYEAETGFFAGYKPSQIMYTPSGVKFDELEEGVLKGYQINVDNLSTLEKFGEKYGNTVPCCLRINPHIKAGGNHKIQTGHKDSKFGISLLQIDQILEITKKYDIVINGLHMHTGSEIYEIDPYIEGAKVLFKLAQNFAHLDFIDFGSGFKVAYKDGDKVTDLKKLGDNLVAEFSAFCDSYGKELEMWFEPGKFLVSESGVLLVKANVVKQTPYSTFVGVDSGLNHLIRPMMYDSYHEIVNVSNPTGKVQNYNVVGYICETDTFAWDRPLNEVREGDILAIKNAGAYGFSMSSNYNSRPRPAEALIVNGVPQLIRNRETIQDILKNQIDIFQEEEIKI